jgi:hypothetical protein
MEWLLTAEYIFVSMLLIVRFFSSQGIIMNFLFQLDFIIMILPVQLDICQKNLWQCLKQSG